MDITELGNRPFSYAICDTVLDPALYGDLSDTFPESILHPLKGDRAEDQKGKAILRNDDANSDEFFDFVDRTPPWRAFYQWTQDGFPRLMEQLFGIAPGYHVQVELSAINSQGGYVRPHADSAVKLAAAIFYFPPPNWQTRWGGELSLFQLKRHGHNRKPRFDEVDTFLSPAYTGNRLVAFKRKKAVSLHGVLPMKGSRHVWRRSVTLTIMQR